jgi:hypothetical protein
MAATFEWMETPRPKKRAKATSGTRDDEVRRRATIFASLGYPQAQAEARLRANWLWEHERIGKPAVLKRLAALVAEAYTRAGIAPAKKKR